MDGEGNTYRDSQRVPVRVPSSPPGHRGLPVFVLSRDTANDVTGRMMWPVRVWRRVCEGDARQARSGDVLYERRGPGAGPRAKETATWCRSHS